MENRELNNDDFELLFRNKINNIDNQINELRALKKLLVKYINPAKK